jgi:hypothetical protein
MDSGQRAIPQVRKPWWSDLPSRVNNGEEVVRISEERRPYPLPP